jgi:hypothetical protein
MTIRKIADAPQTTTMGGWSLPCQSPEHNPPAQLVLEPGLYEHTCPRCGRVMQFSVPQKNTFVVGKHV